MERYVGKHKKGPGYQTRDTASLVDNVIPEGAGPCQAGFYRSFALFRAFEGMPDWPAGLLLSLGPWSALFPGCCRSG